MAQQAVDFSAFNQPDPTEIQDTQDQQNAQAVQNAPTGFQQALAAGNQGFNQLGQGIHQMTGANVGTPQVVQARKVQEVMKGIMAQANQFPDSTDPLDKNLFIAQQIARKMWDVSPQMAGQAMLQTQQLQEARTQQNKLIAETQQEQMKTQGMAQQQKLSAITNNNAVLTDKEGNVVWSHPIDDPNFAQALTKARADNPNSTLTSESEYNKSDIKQRVALISAQAKVDQAMIRAAAQGVRATPADNAAIAQVRKVNPGLAAIGDNAGEIADILSRSPDAMTVGANISSWGKGAIDMIFGHVKDNAINPNDAGAVDTAMDANSKNFETYFQQATKGMPAWQGNTALHTAAMQMAFSMAQSNVNGRLTNYEVQQSINMLNLAASGSPDKALTALAQVLIRKRDQADSLIQSIGAQDIPGVQQMMEYSKGKIQASLDKINGLLAAHKAATIGNLEVISQKEAALRKATGATASGAAAPTQALVDMETQSPEQIRADYKAGKISRDMAKSLLQQKHGMK